MLARTITQLPSAPIALHPYQNQVIRETYDLIREGQKSILLFAPTGAGKTLIASQIIVHAVERGRSCMFVVHRDNLIAQTYGKFQKFGLNCGFIKAGWQENRKAKVQIASVQTLQQRDWWREYQADVVILDECHILAFASVVQQMREVFSNAIWLGLTATPWRLSKREGLGDVFDALVCAPLPYQLIDQGYLVKPSYHGIDPPDLKEVETVAGDFDEGQLAIACDQPKLVKRLVKDWQRLARGRLTIAFAVNVQHSQNICKAFLNAGVPAAHVDGKTPLRQRDQIYQQLAQGEIKVLTSCMTLTEGFDVPSVSCILLCRPTQSKALYFQMVGRGLRLSPQTGKHDCIVLDQAGNIFRHNFIEDLKSVTLGEGQEPEDIPAPLKICPPDSGGCSAILYAFYKQCPNCGYSFELKKIPLILELKQQIREEDCERVEFYREKLRSAFEQQYSPGWAANLFREEYGHWPPDDWARAAVFGEASTDKERSNYQQHLQAIAARLQKPFSWIERYLTLEFGVTNISSAL